VIDHLSAANRRAGLGIELAMVFVGGALGTSLRWGVAELLVIDGLWPWPTLVVNVAGAFGLGWITGRIRHSARMRYYAPLLATGLLGALTTYSAFVYEAVDLWDAEGAAAAVMYAGISVVAGLYAAASGVRRGLS
jgi:CrcB protein